MLFNSLHFFVFFPIVVALYFALPHRFRWVLLLAASYYFYMCWKWRYAVLLVASTSIDYCAGLVLLRTSVPWKRRLCLVLSLGANLAILFSFKYYDFFTHSLQAALHRYGLDVAIPASVFALPVGISFYTLQTMAYTIEVYRGKQPVERSLGMFALYVVFFPQLVAGPIERSGNLLPQLKREYAFDYERVTSGMKLMFWGLFKKVVIADRLGQFVAPVTANPESCDGFILTAASVFFTFQIYCDFSGYSDIAIGAAQVFGVKLMENFRRPFLSRTIAEFWQRWHISLSSWFRDYVYLPLGGNRVSVSRWCFNIMAVFLLSGLWHGANWTFLVWGGMNGVFVLVSRFTQDWRAKAASRVGLSRRPVLHHAFQSLVTFTLFGGSLIVFRSANLRDALTVYSRCVQSWHVPSSVEAFLGIAPRLGMTPDYFAKEAALSVLLIAFLVGVEIVQGGGTIRERLARRPAWLRFCVYSAGLWFLLLFGVFKQKEFIYFAF